MRIVTGRLRGHQIPSHRSLADIRLTSSRLKEAIFSMLGADLAGRTFLDLCAGSGQIGLEACSRGARVILNEPDHRRFAQIRRLLSKWNPLPADLFNRKAQSLIPELQAQEKRFDIIYLDPPYHARRHSRPLSVELLDQLADADLLSSVGLLLVQHQEDLELPVSPGSLTLLQNRPYGNTSLSIYQPA